MKMLNVYSNVSKDKDMLSGSACLYYTLKFVYNMDMYIPDDLNSITDIATFLTVNTNLDIVTTCFNSKLYNNYLKQSSILDFEEFVSLKKYLYVGGTIYEQKLDIDEISSLLYGNIVIAYVSYPIFNKDMMSIGGHFIALLKNKGKDCIIANPKSTSIDIQVVTKRHLLNSIKTFGNWIIAVKR